MIDETSSSTTIADTTDEQSIPAEFNPGLYLTAIRLAGELGIRTDVIIRKALGSNMRLIDARKTKSIFISRMNEIV